MLGPAAVIAVAALLLSLARREPAPVSPYEDQIRVAIEQPEKNPTERRGVSTSPLAADRQPAVDPSSRRSVFPDRDDPAVQRMLGDLMVEVDRALEVQDLGAIYLARQAVLDFLATHPDAAWLLVELATVDDVAIRKEVGRILAECTEIAPGVQGDYAARLREVGRERMDALPERIDQLVEMMRAGPSRDRGWMLERLVELHRSTGGALDALLSLADTNDIELRTASIAALGALDHPRRREVIESFLEDDRPGVRTAALHAAGMTLEPWAGELLAQALEDPATRRFALGRIRPYSQDPRVAAAVERAGGGDGTSR